MSCASCRHLAETTNTWDSRTQRGRKRRSKPLCAAERKRGNHWEWRRKKRLERMKQNLPEELLQSERRVRKMNWYVSRDRAGERDRRLNSVQTGCVNKAFEGVASLDFKQGKPQSQSQISYSLHQSQTLIHQRIQKKKKTVKSGYKGNIRSVIRGLDRVAQTHTPSKHRTMILIKTEIVIQPRAIRATTKKSAISFNG